MLALFLKGLLLGFAIAAPVGPIGILCIHRSLHHGFKSGFLTGIGAALADGTYGLMAGFGLTVITKVLLQYEHLIRVAGGLFLIYLGIKIFISQSVVSTDKRGEKSGWHALTSAYLLTLTNPATILAFIAVFASFGLATTSTSYANALLLVIGITLGSAIWWLLLSSSVAYFLHHKLSPRILNWINKTSSLIVIAFGVFSIY